MKTLLWFHRDLRTHDHSGLNWCLENGHEVVALVCRPFVESSNFKLQFWNECVSELKQNLSTAGIPLFISETSALETIPPLIEEYGIKHIITHRRMNQRDRMEVAQVIECCAIEVKELGDLTLYESRLEQELSLDLLKPFTKFKKFAEANWTVPDELSRHQKISIAPYQEKSWLTGGESAGLQRLHDYVHVTHACLNYHETRNGMLERDDSSKFSFWLAWGALSPRRIYHELRTLEKVVGPCQGIQALIYELVWRDYFKFLAKISGESFFDLEGIQHRSREYIQNTELLERWRRGETGDDFVDANMRELKLTGFMSNRGRQNVASYFAKNLCLDWTLGVKWFEEQLIDEDPENNWGNWQYLAGVGTDPRDRIFDVQKQALAYDSQGIYRRRWLGETIELQDRILSLLAIRSQESSICPSEVLPPEDKKNKQRMDEVRSAARRLNAIGVIGIYQKGEKIDPNLVRGPIRLKKT